MMNRHRQTGFGAIMAIVILVILAALAAAITRMGVTQQLSSVQDIQSARAWQAAKAGTEWGLFQALQPTGAWLACNNASSTLDLSNTTGFWVTVTCNSNLFNEGETDIGVAQAVRVYRINAVACNVAGGCPNNTQATSQGYVERMRQVIATN
jgi:MSHA biogenesis protein MshP